MSFFKEIAKDGSQVIYYQENNEKKRYLSSRYSPKKEAERIVAEENQSKEVSCVVLFGGGNFYLLKVILVKYKDIPVILIEKEKAIYELIKGDILNILPENDREIDKNFFVFYGNKIEEELKQVIKQVSSVKIRFYHNKNQWLLSLDFYQSIKEIIISIQNQKSINKATFSKFETLWVRNVVQNTKKIIQSLPSYLLENCGKNEIGVVVGAGPSLAYDLEFLKEIQDFVVIIACDTSLKILLKKEIIPDFLVVIDPQKINSKYIENISEKIRKQIYIFCDSGICSKGLRNYKKVFMFDSLFAYYKYISLFFGRKGEIDIGGSVASAAYELARILRFKATIFSGIDLCYQSNAYHFTRHNVRRILVFISRKIEII